MMTRTHYLLLTGLLTAAAAANAQTGAKPAAKGDEKKGKATFEQQCALCHDAATTEQKMGPGLKGLFKRPKMATTGKPTSDANILNKIEEGGNGMPPMKDMLSEAERADLIAYLKTL